MKRPRYEFHDGPPPRRGVYRVRSAGPNPNFGWRYWDGKAWGLKCSVRSWTGLLAARKPARLRGRAVLWGAPVREPKRADEVATLRARVTELETALRAADCPYPVTISADETVGACVNSGACGCVLGKPLKACAAKVEP